MSSVVFYEGEQIFCVRCGCLRSFIEKEKKICCVYGKTYKKHLYNLPERKKRMRDLNINKVEGWDRSYGQEDLDIPCCEE